MVFVIILIIIFICGVLSADVFIKQILDSKVLVGMDFYEQYSNAKPLFRDVFWSILYERIKLFILLLLLCFTPIKERIAVILVPLFSFVWGFFLMSSIIQLGVAGLVVGLASVIPHGILYASVIGFILSRRSVKHYHMKNRVAQNIGMVFLMVLLFLTGCIIESLVGTHFIPWVIRLSLI